MQKIALAAAADEKQADRRCTEFGRVLGRLQRLCRRARANLIDHEDAPFGGMLPLPSRPAPSTMRASFALAQSRRGRRQRTRSGRSEAPFRY